MSDKEFITSNDMREALGMRRISSPIYDETGYSFNKEEDIVKMHPTEKSVFMVFFRDMTMGYGEYVHLVGIFENKKDAEEAANDVRSIFNEHGHKDGETVNVHITEQCLNTARYPYYDTENSCYKGGLLGGYAE